MSDDKLPQTIHRNAKDGEYRDHSSKGDKSIVDKEVKRLLKSGGNEQDAWYKLKSKFNNNPALMNSIYEAYKDKYKYIYKKASKFKSLLFNKYAGLNLSQEELIHKAKKYQRKYKLTDEEFSMFIMLATTDRALFTNLYNVANSKMASALGYDAVMQTASKLNVKETEYKDVEETLRLHAETKALHQQVVLQHFTFGDCAPEALLGKFDRVKSNGYSFIHPILAALFLPKFQSLDETMLVANIGSIVERKQRGEPLTTQPDYNLYWAMITDPNDIVCSSLDSAAKDLKIRFKLQTRVWDSVLKLRQGKYYQDSQHNVDFMTAIDECRSNVYDAPDLTYVRDEGTILRRLLSSFSLRPTIVSINRLSTIAVNTFDANSISQLTTVPMVTLRLPVSFTAGSGAPLRLEEALTQPQWFIENKMIVPKSLSLVYSKDVLFFFIGRRFQTINLSRYTSPYNFNALPMTVSGWETLNEYPIHYNETLSIMGDSYTLRSVVLIECFSVGQRKVISGCSTLVFGPLDGPAAGTVFQYDPQGAIPITDDGAGNLSSNGPITWVPNSPSLAPQPGVECAYEKASKRGVIFCYQKVPSVSTNPYLNIVQ